MNAACKTGIFNYIFVEAIIKCFEKKLLIKKWSLGERKVRMLTGLVYMRVHVEVACTFSSDRKKQKKKKKRKKKKTFD